MSKGYTLPGLPFAVEHYKGEFIQRAVMAGDEPPTPEAEAAISAWLANGRAKFAEGVK